MTWNVVFLRATSWHVSPLQICYRRSILPLLNNFKALMKRQRHQSLLVEIICITQDDAKTRQRNDGPCPFLLYLPPSLPSFLPSFLPSSLRPFLPSFLPSFPFLPPFLLLDLPRGVSLGNFRRRGSEAKVRSGLKRVSANTGFASAISTFARNWSSTATTDGI